MCGGFTPWSCFTTNGSRGALTTLVLPSDESKEFWKFWKYVTKSSSSFDQTKTPQFPIVHPPPQETSIEISHDQENDIQELFRKLLDDLQNIHEELAEFINSPTWNHLAVYDDDDDDVDYTIAITPVLSTEKPDNSLSIPDTMCDVYLVNNATPLEDKDQFEIVINSNDDYSSSDDDSLYYENIECVEASPHDSEFVSLESSSTSPKPFLEGTNTFHNSLLEFENFCFDLEEISSGSTTTHSDVSLPEYEAFSFYDDHIEDISSGSTTTHSDVSLPEYEAFSFYDDHIEDISSGSTTTQSDISLPEFDSFTFDLSNDKFPPSDRSDFTHEEFGDEPAHIICPPEYDCFYFGNLPDPGELISSLNSGIRENLSSTTCVNLSVEDDYSPLLAYVVWIFLAYLRYPVIPPHLHSFGNEDTIFDPGITINRSYSFKPGLSHRCGTFKKFNTHCSHLNGSPMEMLFSTLFPLDQRIWGIRGEWWRSWGVMGELWWSGAGVREME
nr:hypothetical protein [Tanacetum cinerariifolium]